MGLGQRRWWSWKGPTSRWWENALSSCGTTENKKYHPSCSRMRSPRDIHKSGPGGIYQVLHNICGIFQGVRQGPWMPRSCYSTADEGVYPPALRLGGHRNGGHWIGPWIYRDASMNLPIVLQQRSPLETLLPQSPYWSPYLQGKKLPINWPWNSILIPYQNLPRPQGRVPWGTYPQNTLWDNWRVQINPYWK